MLAYARAEGCKITDPLAGSPPFLLNCLMPNPHPWSRVNRREFLCGSAASLGLASEAIGDGAIEEEPLSFSNHFQTMGKARSVIVLLMEGGPSHLDTLDPKPELTKRHGTESFRQVGWKTGKRIYVGSPFRFRKVGNAGLPMSDPWVHLAKTEVADELCFYRGCQAQSLSHREALLQINTGDHRIGTPAVGAWVAHGLGDRNSPLPGFAVVPESLAPQGGRANWSNGFLSEDCQATMIRTSGSPTDDPLGDWSTETRATQEAYGLHRNETAAFGRQCLLARRLVETGTRFVQVFASGWDSHDCLRRSHASRITSVDQPIAALIADLKQRGMLDETLVLWTGEFGRTPDTVVRSGGSSSQWSTEWLGREDNMDAMGMWLAGGGIRRGSIVGATDELGAKAVQCVHTIRDVHATLFHLLGLDHQRLIHSPSGQSPSRGTVIGELIA